VLSNMLRTLAHRVNQVIHMLDGYLSNADMMINRQSLSRDNLVDMLM